MPALFVGYFWYHGKYYSAALVLFWVGEKHFECFRLRRRLVGATTTFTRGQDSIHDWNYMLGHSQSTFGNREDRRWKSRLLGTILIALAAVALLDSRGAPTRINLDVTTQRALLKLCRFQLLFRKRTCRLRSTGHKCPSKTVYVGNSAGEELAPCGGRFGFETCGLFETYYEVDDKQLDGNQQSSAVVANMVTFLITSFLILAFIAIAVYFWQKPASSTKRRLCRRRQGAGYS